MNHRLARQIHSIRRPTAEPVARPGRRRGMTLLEVLVASVLLGVGVAGLVSAAGLALRNQSRLAHRAAALLLAQEQIQQVDVVGAYAWQIGYPMHGSESRGDVAYEWTLDIEHLGVGELHRVRADVNWKSPTDEGRAELETWLSDYRNTGEATETPTETQNPNASPRGR